jgi:hypothetical protein
MGFGGETPCSLQSAVSDRNKIILLKVRIKYGVKTKITFEKTVT